MSLKLKGFQRSAAKSRRPHAMAVQRYDVRDGSGAFVERYWRPLNTPVFDGAGKLKFVLHQVHDVTKEVLALRFIGTQPSRR